MRTIDLIRALTDPDIKAIEKSLNGLKREGLRLAFREMKKYASRSNYPTHKELFEKIMGEAYTKEKDYLLRNKMRQINELIYEYLAIDTFRKHLTENSAAYDYWLAKAYYDRRLNNLFESDMEGFLNRAKQTVTQNESGEPSYSGYLHSLQSIWKIHYERRNADSVKAQSALLGEWLNEEKRRFLYKIREIEAREAFLKAALGYENTTTDTAVVIDLSEQEKGDPLVHYLVMKKKLNETSGWKKVEVLKEMLIACDRKEYSMVTTPNSKIANKVLLARELILLGEFKEANRHLEEVLSNRNITQSPQLMSAIQNHLTNQINLGQYKKGIKIYEKYTREIRQSNHARSFDLHLSLLYLFLGRGEDALASLPDAAKLSKQLQIYHRFAFMMAFILRDDYTLAGTEAKNMKRYIKRNNEGDFSYYLEIIDLFEEYISALGPGPREKESRMNKLKAKFKADLAEWNLKAIDIIPLRWLMVRLGL